MGFERLFEPIRIGGMEVRNRLVMAPMTTGYASMDGVVSDRIMDYYVERAMGGVGLIVVEQAYVMMAGKSALAQLAIDTDELVSGLKRLTDALHDHGACVSLQLNHGGRYSHGNLLQALSYNVGVSP